jgi:Tfp pilus assembly protein PilX
VHVKDMSRIFLRKSGERGAVLVTALIVFAIGALLVIPAASLMTAGLNAGIANERQTDMIYAADSGIEDAIWKINKLPDSLPGELGTSGDTYSYLLPATVNEASVNVKIEYYSYELGLYIISSSADDAIVKAVISRSPGTNLTAFKGALVSSGNIDLAKNSHVTGDIICGGSFTYDEGTSTIDGSITQNVPAGDLVTFFPSASEVEDFASTYKDEAMSGTIYPDGLNIEQNENITLGDSYIIGNFTVEKDATVNLAGTIYVTGYIDMDKDATITGSGSIIAVGSIGIAKLSNYNQNGSAIIFSLTGDISFKKECSVNALVYAPSGSVTFDKGATEGEYTVTGSIVCGGEVTTSDSYIEARKNFNIVFDSTYSDTFVLPGYIYGEPSILSWEIS